MNKSITSYIIESCHSEDFSQFFTRIISFRNTYPNLCLIKNVFYLFFALRQAQDNTSKELETSK